MTYNFIHKRVRSVRAMTLALAIGLVVMAQFVFQNTVAYGQRATLRPGGAASRGVQNANRGELTIGTDPFAARSNREARSEQAPGVASDATLTSSESDIANTSVGGELDYPDIVRFNNGRVLTCRVEGISGRTGATLATAQGQVIVSLTELESLEVATSAAFLSGVACYESWEELGARAQLQRAASYFEQARAQSTRRIEREWATAKLAQVRHALGDYQRAAEEFFVLCRADGYTAYLSSIPLRWQNQRLSFGVGEGVELASSAQKWLLERENPSARLLAASILLNSSGATGERALATLQALASSAGSDENVDEERTMRNISLLATAQLWRRTLLSGVKATDVAKWRGTVTLLPEQLRSGPSSVVAHGYKSLGMDAEALHFFLLSGLLGAQDYETSRASCQEASAALERLGRTWESQCLRTETERRYER